MVDSPFNEDSKNKIFSREALISGEGWPGKFREMANNKDIYTFIVMQIGGGQFEKSRSVPTPWYQNPCNASTFLHARPNFREKN